MKSRKNNKVILRRCVICKGEYSRFSSHIKSHGITPEEYYAKYLGQVGGKCKISECNNTVNFQGATKGYSEYCSNSCSVKGQHLDPTFSRNNSIRFSKLQVDSGYITKRSLEYLSKANTKGVTEGIFYIMKFKDLIKIGICYYINKDLDYFNHRIHRLRPDSSEIFYGLLIDVVNYENYVKINYTSIKGSEYFPHELYNEIKSNIPININSLNQ